MRIVSGKLKGRHIPVRKNFPSRPTTDFAKENLFNVLGNHFDFDDLEVLDLFAGTGSISYEFASRGSRVDLVEKDYRSFSFILSTLKELKLEKVRPLKADVFRAVQKLSRRYDIVFADPPYQLNGIDALPDLIFENRLLKPEGWFILEHGREHVFSGHPRFSQVRVYGSVHFSVFTESRNQ